MKITKAHLKNIIQEEILNILAEQGSAHLGPYTRKKNERQEADDKKFQWSQDLSNPDPKKREISWQSMRKYVVGIERLTRAQPVEAWLKREHRIIKMAFPLTIQIGSKRIKVTHAEVVSNSPPWPKSVKKVPPAQVTNPEQPKKVPPATK